MKKLAVCALVLSALGCSSQIITTSKPKFDQNIAGGQANLGEAGRISSPHAGASGGAGGNPSVTIHNTHDAGMSDDEDAGSSYSDAGVFIRVSADARVMMAYCGAAVMDKNNPPTSCVLQTSDAGVRTTLCDTGLKLEWSCEACGVVTKQGITLAHFGVLSNTLYQVTPTGSVASFMCELSADGKSLKVSNYR